MKREQQWLPESPRGVGHGIEAHSGIGYVLGAQGKSAGMPGATQSGLGGVMAGSVERDRSSLQKQSCVNTVYSEVILIRLMLIKLKQIQVLTSLGIYRPRAIQERHNDVDKTLNWQFRTACA